MTHKTVLLDEAVEALVWRPDGIYVDGTFGRGGHTRAILQRLSDQGRVLVFDKDPEAIAVAEQLAGQDARVTVVHESFADLEAVLAAAQIEQVDGVLLDLGVSSPQLDDAERGFSFMRQGPLDMRMDSSRGPSAADWINHADVEEITQVLREFGEERHAWRIANAIVARRVEQPFTTTLDLAQLIAENVPKHEPGKHPATRSFQAIRIHINRELADLQRVLPAAFAHLAVGGRFVVISFHSLEDRMVKRYFKNESKGDQYPAGVPVTSDMIRPKVKLLGKARKAGAEELDGNVRARSAVMRVAEVLR